MPHVERGFLIKKWKLQKVVQLLIDKALESGIHIVRFWLHVRISFLKRSFQLVVSRAELFDKMNECILSFTLLLHCNCRNRECSSSTDS